MAPKVEEFPPRLPVLPHHPVVQFGKLRDHGRVEFFEVEEPFVPQGGQAPSFDALDRHLGLGLVPGFSGAGRDDHHAIMLGQFLVCRIDIGVVMTGFGDDGLESANNANFENYSCYIIHANFANYANIQRK